MNPRQTERLLWAALASCDAVGVHFLQQLREHTKSAEEAWNSLEAFLPLLSIRSATCERVRAWKRSLDLSRFEDSLEKAGIQIVLRTDKDYPLPLTTIYDPPEVLFVRGALPSSSVCIAVVGTRAPTDYGYQALTRLVTPVAEKGIPLISGLAWGIDAAAHELALKESCYTCAVLGSGVDQETIYPAHNRALAERIIEQGGGILSESPPGRKPRPESFPIRNRIIAGLAQAVVVIEATTESGTLITANAALEAGREVLAVPGSIWSEKSAGTHQLLRSGARLCADASDIFEALKLDRVETCAHAQLTLPLGDDERTVFAQLSEPHTIDELTRLLNWSIGRINQAMSMLELKQLVLRLPHHAWGRK